MKYEFNGNMNSTYGTNIALSNMVEDVKKVYIDIDNIALFGTEDVDTIFCQPCQYNIELQRFESTTAPLSITIKDKTLEVIERDFQLKYPRVYKIFKEGQDRQLLEFIKKYTKNLEEI